MNTLPLPNLLPQTKLIRMITATNKTRMVVDTPIRMGRFLSLNQSVDPGTEVTPVFAADVDPVVVECLVDDWEHTGHAIPVVFGGTVVSTFEEAGKKETLYMSIYYLPKYAAGAFLEKISGLCSTEAMTDLSKPFFLHMLICNTKVPSSIQDLF